MNHTDSAKGIPLLKRTLRASLIGVVEVKLFLWVFSVSFLAGHALLFAVGALLQ